MDQSVPTHFHIFIASWLHNNLQHHFEPVAFPLFVIKSKIFHQVHMLEWNLNAELNESIFFPLSILLFYYDYYYCFRVGFSLIRQDARVCYRLNNSY